MMLENHQLFNFRTSAKPFSRTFKVFDPWVEKDVVENQYHGIDKFLSVDMVILMVKHKHILDNMDKLKEKSFMSFYYL